MFACEWYQIGQKYGLNGKYYTYKSTMTWKNVQIRNISYYWQAVEWAES